MSNRIAADLVRRFEGLRLRAYRCPAGVWTVGYGHTKDVPPGLVITEAEAEALLEEDLKEAGAAVDRLVRVPLREEQRAALVSFVFNVGAGALGRSTLLRRLNAGQHEAVPGELGRWNKSGGKVLPGLVMRRAAEADVWQGVGK